MLPTSNNKHLEPRETNQDPRESDRSPKDIALLKTIRTAIHAQAARPDEYWQRQRSAIQSRIMKRAPLCWRRPQWISLAAATVLVILVILVARHAERPPAKVVTISEHDLLINIDRALDKRVPTVLEPALLLTEEMVKNEK